MNKVIIFDLYDTVLEVFGGSFELALSKLHMLYFRNVCRKEQFMKLVGTYQELFDENARKNIQLSIMRDEVLPIFRLYEVAPPADLDDLEWAMLNWVMVVNPEPPIRKVLSALQEKGYDIYILSNSGFSRKAIERSLKHFEIDHFFKKVYVSSEYGVRKPDQAFFDAALSEILADHPGLERKDITFVGDSLETDAVGGREAGLNTYWLNRRNRFVPRDVGVKQLKSRDELWEVVK